MNLTSASLVLGYVALFVGTLLAVTWWDRRKRRTRKPFPEDLKLVFERPLIDSGKSHFLSALRRELIVRA